MNGPDFLYNLYGGKGELGYFVFLRM